MMDRDDKDMSDGYLNESASASIYGKRRADH